MPTNMKFGECLRYLLSIVNISIVKLAKVINVDTSLVNKWINEKRTPSYNTDYIEKISEYLSSCILNSFQIEYLDNLFLKIFGDNKTEINTKEKIMKILLQSQGYSIECRRLANKEMKKQLINQEKVLNSFIDPQYQVNQTDSINIYPNLITPPSNEYSINLSNEDKIIIGFKNVIAIGIYLLEKASTHKCANDDVIYISLDSNMFMPYYSNDLNNFRDYMLKAIHAGWSIQFLLKLNNSINNVVNLIEFVRPLIGTGKFHPYCFKKYHHFSTYQEFIVVPNLGTLLQISSNFNSETDTAFYFSNTAAINIIKNNVESMFINDVNSIVKYYTHDDAIDYSDFLAEQEDIIGNRILYKRDFSILVLSESLYKKFVNRINLTSSEIDASLKFYNRRLKAFLSNVKNYSYTDIYHIDCINNLIKWRKFKLYLYNKVLTISLEVDDVIEILKNLVTLLKNNTNYNIAFIFHDNNVSDFEFYCIVKERTSIVAETYSSSKDKPLVRLTIKDPLLVKAFEVYLNEVLEQIPPINKDKKEIINWLEREIKLLENK